ncbi:MAG: acetylglutamate kinase [Vicinamibacterales bacterium]
MSRIVVLKFGGELLEDPARTRAIAGVVRKAAARGPLVVVHGGGREIDRSLAAAGIPKHQVDGLRVTDEATLDVVVQVLAGLINTRLVATLNAAGVRAVGLTGADATVAPVRRAPVFSAADGRKVSLGRVGVPTTAGAPALLTRLTGAGFVPVVASVSADGRGGLFNVNADTLAGSLAARLRAGRLVVAGATAGVLDAAGATVPLVDATVARAMVKAGTASAGMIAKLAACRLAAGAGVGDVRIADGRTMTELLAALEGRASGPWTRVE